MSDQRLALDAETLEALASEMEEMDLGQRLQRSASLFEPGELAVVSAFGPGSLVILHTLREVGIRLPVLFIDTLHHFPETLETVERVRERLDLDLRVYRHCDSREQFEERYGPRLWERDLDRYQELAKVEPFRRATGDLKAWITGRRRGQSETRAELPVIEGTDQIHINPLADWDRSSVWNYILRHDLPYNPLHDQGYSSIGDEPLTTPVKPGEDERAGRWRGSERTECGIHQI